MKAAFFGLILTLVCSFASAMPWYQNLEEVVAMQGAVPQDVPASEERAIIENDFEEIKKFAGVSDVKLIVTDNPLFFAQTFPKTVVVFVGMSSISKSHRMFILAHEMGHVLKNHWDHTFLAVKVLTASQASEDIGSAALTSLSHSHEFEADAFAAEYFKFKGIDLSVAREVLSVLGGESPDSDTHPAISRRIDKLH